MSAGLHVLVVDGEKQIRRFLKISLEAQHYRVHESAAGEEALAKAMQLRPDLIILDINLPDMDGYNVLKRLREWTHTPVIVLSERSGEKDKVAALDAGADDYVTKPFSVNELLARLRVAQRHAQKDPGNPVVQVGDLQIDLARRLVTRRGKPVKLTPTEYALLRLLVQHWGQVLTHRQILREIWGPAYVHKTRYLHVYMAQLRQKLETDPALPALIITEAGVGYRLVSEPPKEQAGPHL